MEKIQQAIAKARAVREAATGTATGSPNEVQSNLQSNPVVGHQAGSGQGPAANVATPLPVPPPVAQPATDIAQNWLSLPAFRPDTRHLARHRIVAYESGGEAVGFDMLRTRLLQQMRTNNWRRVAITSPGPGCGKSTLAMNLGFSLGRQQDQRTVVAEMDMRRPSMTSALGLSEHHSFARVLEGQGTFRDNALRHASSRI
jgi:protein-tyrosine kinase